MLLKLLVASGALLTQAYAIAVEKASLRANGAYDPLDVDTASPRLTWRLSSPKRGDAQTGYRIQASSSPNFTEVNLWDSGKVDSSNPYAFYAGNDLKSRSAVFWRVQVWDVNGEVSAWSTLAKFEVSLLNADDWEAKWISNKKFKTGNTSLPVFAKDFAVDCEVFKARLYLLGLGLHIPEINGEEITDEVLQPGYSTVNDTLLYSTYDVTNHLVKGNNVIGVSLGKGIYNAEKPLLGRYRKFEQAYQELRLIAQLEYQCVGGKTEKILSDNSWLTSVDGPYWETSWYGGEEYDARKELTSWSTVDFDRSSWAKADLTQGPPGKFLSPRSPPLKITETIKPVSVKKNDKGFWVYDFGVNFAGTFSFTMKIRGGEVIRITFWPDERSGLGQGTTGGPIFDAYTMSSAETQIYSPKWLYHGFQFLGVNTTWEPSLDDMVGYVIRAENEPVLSFSTSDQLFNDIHRIIDRSIKGNMHSVLTDCPHREKYGWLEQDHLVFEPVALGYDIQAYGDDLIRTIADAQAEDVPGLIPDIAPEFGKPMGGGYRNDPNWGVAIIKVPYLLYHYYGDINVLRMRHRFMREYLDYLQRRANGNPWLDDGGLGDWLGLDKTTPKGSTSTFGYHQAAYYLSKVEAILGNDVEAATYAKLAQNIREGFHSKWFNETGGPHYCANSQACNAMALDIGAVPEHYEKAVSNEIIKSLEEGGWHMTVGEIALPSLFQVLTKGRRQDVLYKIMTLRTMPSYGYQLEHGATTLWEHWDADTTGGSLNHFMYGYGDLWLLQLSGLSQKNTSVAWKEIVFDPIIQGDLTSAESSYVTPTGIASASWSLHGNKFTYGITVPVGSRGWVYMKANEIWESGSAAKPGENGIISIKKGCQRTIVEIGSGRYEFTTK